jgi:hypothetical protein
MPAKKETSEDLMNQEEIVAARAGQDAKRVAAKFGSLLPLTDEQENMQILLATSYTDISQQVLSLL